MNNPTEHLTGSLAELLAQRRALERLRTYSALRDAAARALARTSPLSAEACGAAFYARNVVVHASAERITLKTRLEVAGVVGVMVLSADEWAAVQLAVEAVTVRVGVPRW